MIETLAKLTPALKEKRKRGWIFAVLITTCSIGAAVAAPLFFNNNEPRVIFFLVFIGIVGVFGMNTWVIRGQQRLVMPHLAKAVDLTYQQDAKSFLHQLPTRLLPRSSVRTAEDCISGSIGEREVTLAEVKIKTGGKNSRTLFKGFVIRFQNAAPLPAFFIAPKRKTDEWFSRINVKGLIETDAIMGKKGEVFGVWLSENGAAEKDPALKAVLNILTRLETKIGGDVRLFSATSNGEEMHIALSHSNDLFRIGGLLASDDQITKSIQTAFEDLNVPLRIVSILLEAERQAELNRT